MSARHRGHDRHRAMRDLRRQHQRAMASVVRDPNADLWVGYWSDSDDLLLEYAKAGVPDTIRRHLAAHPHTKRETLNLALRFAEGEWRDRRNDRHSYVATMEVLLTAGAAASILPADMIDVLPTLQTRAFDAEFPGALVPSRTLKRI